MISRGRNWHTKCTLTVPEYMFHCNGSCFFVVVFGVFFVIKSILNKIFKFIGFDLITGTELTPEDSKLNKRQYVQIWNYLVIWELWELIEIKQFPARSLH